MKKRLLALAAVALAGCVSVSETNVENLSELGSDAVLVVGKIEIVPPIRPEEQSYKALDPFNSKRHFMGRAVMFMSDKREYQEYTGDALNPPLQETYFLKVPRTKRYMVKGSVTMAFALRTVSRRQAVTDQAELMFPAPLEFDLRPADRAVYVGTLRLHRDEFHEVTRAEVRDDYARAAAEYRAKFPGAPLPRKALLRR
ncbi:MAG TPA: hypothetical protein VFZ84_02730 [Burkholderiales bacterium]